MEKQIEEPSVENEEAPLEENIVLKKMKYIKKQLMRQFEESTNEHQQRHY
jgi:hypothetical protein